MILVERTDQVSRFVNRFEGVLPKALTVTHPHGGLKVVVESLKNGDLVKTELNFTRSK